MSSLRYYNYKGIGELHREKYWYSQAVKVGGRIELSGQGGWDPETGKISTDLKVEIEQAFSNIELAIKDAGGAGFSQVYKVNSYHTEINDEIMEIMVSNMKKWMPNHQPLWTLISGIKLGLPDMRVEIEVVAIDEEAK